MKRFLVGTLSTLFFCFSHIVVVAIVAGRLSIQTIVQGPPSLIQHIIHLYMYIGKAWWKIYVKRFIGMLSTSTVKSLCLVVHGDIVVLSHL